MLVHTQSVLGDASRTSYKPRLLLVLVVTLSMVVVPAFAVILTAWYHQNALTIHQHIDSELGRTQVDTSRALVDYIQPVVDSTSIIARILSIEGGSINGSSPHVRELFFDLLFRVPRVQSLHVSLEDGSGYQLSRLNQRVRERFADRSIPERTVYIGRSIENRGASARRTDMTTLFDASLLPIETVETPSNVADRETEAYLGARQTKKLFVSDRDMGLMTGLPLFSVAAPILRNGAFEGAVIGNVSLFAISKFLRDNRMTANGRSFVIDPDNRVVATSDLNISDIPSEKEDAALKEILAASDKVVEKVLALDDSHTTFDNSFLSYLDGVEYSISVFQIPNRAQLRYRAIILTPTQDFLGGLQKTSRHFAALVCAILILELILIAIISRVGSRGIQAASRQIGAIRSMEFEDDAAASNPPIHEVAELHRGVALLRSALKSFSLYVPLGVVKKLIEESKPIQPGVEPRHVTILFCDLVNFSTVAQRVSPDELLEYMTTFFSIATRAVAAEDGTVDKFIGDCVMAIWGAPHSVEDHATRACRAALTISRELHRISQEWVAQGKAPLEARVGINSAEVLVGNIGSNDRLSYTALGDGVNIASRLEGINKELGTTICISDNTYELAKESITARPIRPVSVKGRTGEFMVYELLDACAKGEKNDNVLGRSDVEEAV